MLRLTVTRRIRAKLPHLTGFSREFWDDAGKIVIGGVLDNIAKQKTAEGGPLKVNAPSTRDRKRRQGKPLLSLVDELHRLVRAASWTIVRFLPRGSGIVVGAATAQVGALMRHVQEAGYQGWFGVSKAARAALKARLRLELQRLVGRAA